MRLSWRQMLVFSDHSACGTFVGLVVDGTDINLCARARSALWGITGCASRPALREVGHGRPKLWPQSLGAHRLPGLVIVSLF